MFGLPRTEHWLPEFCRAPTVFAIMLLAELVVLIAVLAPHGGKGDTLSAVAVASLLAQSIALPCTAVLCWLRTWLLRLPSPFALAAVLAVVLLATFAMSWLAINFDRALDIGLVPNDVTSSDFVGGCILLALLMSLLGVRYGYMHTQWRAQIEAQARAEVDALTARIRPHFLFNSMNTVAGLVRVDPERAEQLIEDLSELFRAALTAGAEPHSLERELDLCERYLEIERLRIGDRLRVRWRIDDALLSQPVLPLLLQPLVENAVYHGVQPLAAGGEVEIRAERRGAKLRLCITNPIPDSPSPTRGHGVALKNIERRLALAYGSGARMDIERQSDRFLVSVEQPMKSP